jgi:hypothetical protein
VAFAVERSMLMRSSSQGNDVEVMCGSDVEVIWELNDR